MQGEERPGKNRLPTAKMQTLRRERPKQATISEPISAPTPTAALSTPRPASPTCSTSTA